MSNTGTDGETIETSCLWNEKGSGQVQMIWAIQEWSFTTAATSYNVYTFNQLRSGTWSHQTPSRWSKRSHHTNTLRLPAKPVDMNYTWPCAVMCTPVDLFHPQRSVQSAADVASPAQSGTWHKTYTLLIALRKEVLTRGETQPRLVFSLQHEHVILVFSSHLLNHSKHSQLCPFSIQLHVVLH